MNGLIAAFGKIADKCILYCAIWFYLSHFHSATIVIFVSFISFHFIHFVSRIGILCCSDVFQLNGRCALQVCHCFVFRWFLFFFSLSFCLCLCHYLPSFIVYHYCQCFVIVYRISYSIRFSVCWQWIENVLVQHFIWLHWISSLLSNCHFDFCCYYCHLACCRDANADAPSIYIYLINQ